MVSWLVQADHFEGPGPCWVSHSSGRMSVCPRLGHIFLSLPRSGSVGALGPQNFSRSAYRLGLTHLSPGAQTGLMNQTRSNPFVSHASHSPCLYRKQKQNPLCWELTSCVSLTRLSCPGGGYRTSLDVAVKYYYYFF